MTKRTIDPEGLARLIDIVDRGLGELPPIDTARFETFDRRDRAASVLIDRLCDGHGARRSGNRITLGGITASSCQSTEGILRNWRAAAHKRTDREDEA